MVRVWQAGWILYRHRTLEHKLCLRDANYIILIVFIFANCEIHRKRKAGFISASHTTLQWAGGRVHFQKHLLNCLKKMNVFTTCHEACLNSLQTMSVEAIIWYQLPFIVQSPQGAILVLLATHVVVAYYISPLSTFLMDIYISFTCGYLHIFHVRCAFDCAVFNR